MPEIAGYYIPTWVCVALPTAVLLYKYASMGQDKFRKKGIPGPRPFPLIGTMYTLMKRGLMDDDMYLKKTYGKMVGTFQGSSPILMVYDLDMLKEIMIKEFSSFENHNDIGTNAYVIRKFLTVIKSDHWRQVRNSLTPTFSGGKLRRMTGAINGSCRNLVSQLSEKVEKGEVAEMKAISGYFTMDVIATTAFGLDIDSKNNPENETVKQGKAIMDTFSGSFNLKTAMMIICPKLMMKLGISIFPKGCMAYFTSLVEHAMKFRGAEEKKAKDFLQLIIDSDQGDPTEKDMATNPDLVKTTDGLIYSQKGLTREEIIASSFLFFLAGFDTTSAGLSFLFYNLACNPDQQEELYREITEVMDGQDEPDYDLIKKMPYLQMCIEESLRLFPPAPRTDRYCNQDVVVNGVHIEKGMTIGIPNWGIHRDPEIWPEPDKFIPERFTPEEKEARHPMAWMPFGQGPRNCVGMRLALMEIKFAVIHVIKNFRLVTCDETQIPLKLPKISMTPKDGIKIKLESR